MNKQFSGKYAFLSNMYNCTFTIHHYTFNSVEQAYQLNKMFDGDNGKATLAILNAKTSAEIKRLGRIFPIRKGFEQDKLRIMEIALRAKFLQNPELLQKLKEVPDKDLIEYNYWHDNYWGYCTCSKCAYKEHHNYLGKLLQEIKGT